VIGRDAAATATVPVVDGMSVAIDRSGEWSVLHVDGEVDLSTAPRLREQLLTLVLDGTVRVVVDLTGTEVLDSTGLGALMAAYKRLRARGGEMRLVITTPRIRKVFEITRLDLVLSIFESIDAAVAT
jgi:anti-sigma B factor antagonist